MVISLFSHDYLKFLRPRLIERYVFFFHLLTQILRFALACCIPFRLTNDTNDDDIGRNSRNDSNVEVR